MAEPDKRSEIERLLAEAEATLGGPPAGSPRRRSVATRRAGMTAHVRDAAMSGAVAAAAVWVLFALLPFLRAGSGAAGAFLAAFVAVLVLRRR